MGALKEIVILHGWTYSLDKWHQFVKLLKDKGFETELAQIPGLTQKSDEAWDLDKYVEWLDRFLSKYNGKVILLGHSNGGRIAISYTSKYPNKIEKLILVDSAGIFHNEFPIKLKRFVFKCLSKICKRFTKSNFLRKALYKIAGESDYERASENMRKTITNLININLTPKLKEIITPTLIIWGENDGITPVKDAYLMKDLIKGSSLHIVKNAKHSPFFTNPEEVVRIIKNDI